MPHRSWDFPLDGSLRSSCAIAKNGTIYATTQHTLYALSEAGTLAWSAPVSPENAAPALGADGTVYVANAGTGTVALDAFGPDGSLKWETPIQGSPELQNLSSPTIASDGTIFVGTMSGPLTAVSPDGSIRWTAGDPYGRYAAPVIAGDGTLFTMELSSFASHAEAFAPDGSRLLSVLVGATYSYTDYPVLGAAGALYVPVARGLFAMTLTGTRLWTQAREDDFTESLPAVGSDGTIYVSGAGIVSAIRADGTLAWTYAEGTADHGGPVALGSDDTIYVGGNKLWMVSPAGILLRTFDVGSATSSSLAIDADGTVLFGGEDGKLHAR
jgi:outer membrane protein assembly factor BamB